MSHPRHRGPVLDAHCHLDATTRDRAGELLRLGGLRGLIQLWDLELPPRPFAAGGAAWDALAPAVARCHVPDLSAIGAPGFGAALVAGLRAAHAAGAVGVKVWKNLGLWERDAAGTLVAVDDPRLDGLWRTAAELRTPVVIHVGDPPAFFAPLADDNPRIAELRAHPDWWWGGPGFPALEELHAQFARLVARQPDTLFVAAHFGVFLPVEEVGRMLDRRPNLHVDTAAAIADMGRDPARVREIIVAHPDRVLFGTDLIRTARWDMPELAARWDLAGFYERHWRFFETATDDLAHPLPAQGAWTVRGLDLPGDVLEQLYSANARRLFGI